MNLNDTIVAISTPAGSGAIAVIRMSGAGCVPFLESRFSSRSGKSPVVPGRVMLGYISEGDEVIDEVLVTWFKGPHSYTGDDVAEISCHGSVYIQNRLLQVAIASGIRLAEPGEFTFRAFMNGRMDLAQAEGVADLIASATGYQHRFALKQMRGGISGKLKELRGKLVNFASLLELELDFSQEDVEFADRGELISLLETIASELQRLSDTFRQGNALKQGIPVTIAGRPNSGKSTLLNALLQEERAIVSEIPGTTRDAIEDTLVISGIPFRFIDTAGLRAEPEIIEAMGIEKTWEKISQAAIILYVFDTSESTIDAVKEELAELSLKMKEVMSEEELAGKKVIIVGNKIDRLMEFPHHFRDCMELEVVFISAKRHENMQLLTDALLHNTDTSLLQEELVITSLRHYEALQAALKAISDAHTAMIHNLPADLVATDIRETLYHIGLITGEISTDELLGNIFGRFCIGK
ncbi:MAG TPA: tRNA uridine-5-carboxymethylaminomethyl(34) synthesis GTPase MnmE [Bacteroidales bacterium]|nr:tRNA uridine-5-carboxymethylaminomethyl(34) synthesis GTPase MnmE [Bacteroidales bacterium]HRZ49987.1 tRNA uridine-5-carboxymethylaminomethyl(34) synthesis GTPase MnmE [Bacteroidales bacterium]